MCKLCLNECDLDGNLSELVINDIPVLNILEKIIYNLNWTEIVVFPNKICSECLRIVENVHQLNEKCLGSDTRLKKLLATDEDGEIIVQEVVTVLEDDGQILEIEKIDAAERKTEMSLNDSNAQQLELSSVKVATVEEDEYEEPRGRHKCQHCNKAFDEASKLSRHIKIIHNMTIKEEKFHKCVVCDKEFSNQEAFAYHMKTHKDVIDKNEFQCLFCTEKFRKLNDLTSHAKTHPENKSCKSYKCLICSKTFTQGSHLIDHLNRHNNLRPHVCKICSKGS